MLKKKGITLFVCLVFVAMLMLGCSSTPKKVTMEKFNKIQTGMSYNEVKAVMGDAGELGAETTMPAVPGVMGALNNKIYMWKNSDGSNMNVQFQNDKVMGKAQAGL